MRRRRNTLVRFFLLLSTAWSAVGMEIHACSGPLSPGSCLQVLCNLVLPPFFAGTESLEVPPPDLGDSSESPPDSSHATTRTVDPSSVRPGERSVAHPVSPLSGVHGADTRMHASALAQRPAHSLATDRVPPPLIC